MLGVWIVFPDGEKIAGSDNSNLQTGQSEATLRYVAPSLTASVQRTSVIAGESIVLYINGSGVSAVPDTSGLLANFRIIGSNTSNATRVKDGVSFQMRLELQPRQAGILIIPSFFVDGVVSKQIVVDVVPGR